ncbi:MAG TPA: RnfABCDGE type electron transport complex subunit D [Sedimentisphaerales bacterium]|nr:RnfABCDGE type electron transport complex subunit D [Sedimentisphaerales bacterium]
MAELKGARTILARQPINRRVLLALLPCLAGGVYFFGWRSLFMVGWAALVGFVVELIFTRLRGERVSEAVFVTTTIFAVIMPPTVGVHVLTIGVAFAVMFAKEIFGGFGRNIFNPAMAGRCFVYICFPVALTSTWAPVAEGPWGALRQWTTAAGADATTGATPMSHMKAGRIVLRDGAGKEADSRIPTDIEEGQVKYVRRSAFLRALAVGRISGTMGVTSAVLIMIGGLYLYYTKTASRTIILSVTTTYAVLNQVLYWFGVDPVPGALPAVLGGGFLFGAFYMATDPVSAPRTEAAKIVYGIIIGVCSTAIRNFSIFNGGLMFSILIGNMFAPILDHVVREYKTTKAAKETG